jgi:HK97 family phage portal protein
MGGVLRPSLLRAAWWDDNVGAFAHHDPTMDATGSDLMTPQLRRQAWSHADLMVLYSSVFAAVRKRATSVTKPDIQLLRARSVGDEEPELIGTIQQSPTGTHPALDALKRVNGSLTFKQGFGLIEQHKCTAGPAYWVKRRANGRRGADVLEFEIWNPFETRIVPREDKDWEPLEFRRRTKTGEDIVVSPEDMIWMRYAVDPRNMLRSLSPVGAVRVNVETSMEAARMNQRFFDNNAMPDTIWSLPEGGPAEVERITQELERKFKGTDNKHRTMVLEGDLQEISTHVSNKDMEFMEQQRWTLQQVAVVYEIAPVLMGDMNQATKDNLDHFTRDFWSSLTNEAQLTLDEMTEGWLDVDYKDEGLFFGLDVSQIPALQEDRELAAKADVAYAQAGILLKNEIRERLGLEAIDGLDDAPATGAEEEQEETPPPPPDEDAAAPITVVLYRGVEGAEDEMATGWERRLRSEMRLIITYLKERFNSRQRVFAPGDVTNYDWAGWWLRYRRDVERELSVVFLASLSEQGFVETPLLPAQQVASNYAARAGAQLLQASGDRSLIDLTRRLVGREVAKAIEEGIGPRTLANRLRENFAFSKGRAEMIARTETAFATSEASLKSYQSLGHEGKEWLTAGDERVDGGDPSGPCQQNEAEGPLALGRPFPSSHDAPPAHPRCRCTLLPVRELPRRKIAERDDDGRILRVVERTG